MKNERATPVFIEKLKNHFGSNKLAGEEIGCTGQAVSQWLRTNDAPLMAELAAQQRYEALTRPMIQTVVLVSFVHDKTHLETLRVLTEALGVVTQEINL